MWRHQWAKSYLSAYWCHQGLFSKSSLSFLFFSASVSACFCLSSSSFSFCFLSASSCSLSFLSLSSFSFWGSAFLGACGVLWKSYNFGIKRTDFGTMKLQFLKLLHQQKITLFNNIFQPTRVCNIIVDADNMILQFGKINNANATEPMIYIN